MNNMYPHGMYPNTNQSHGMPIEFISIEPYVFTALRSLIGKRVVIDTSRGPVSGFVADAKPDHVVIQEHESTFFVRTKEIIWIMPEN